MNKYSDNSRQLSTIGYIKKFSNDFSGLISFDVKLKLEISKLYLSGLTTPEIKNKISKLYSSGRTTPKIKNQKLLHLKHPLSPKEKAILSLYLKPDCNKLYRIRKQSTPEGIIKMIKLKNICTYIIQKYPSPDLAGLPYDYWTPYRLKTYISLLFGVSKAQISEKTVSNNLSIIYNNKQYRTNGNLPPIISPTHYYLYIKIHKLQKKEYRGERKCNRFIYATLFQLIKKKFTYTGKTMSKLYYANGKATRYYSPTLYDILGRLLQDGGESPKTTIYIEDNSLKKFRKRSFDSLEALPAYRFVLFDFGKIMNIQSVKKLDVNDDIESLKKLTGLKQELDQISFSHPYGRNFFTGKYQKKLQIRVGIIDQSPHNL